MASRSLRISSRFALVLVVLVPSLLAVIGVGFHGLMSVRDSADNLYSDHLLTTLDVSQLHGSLQEAQVAGLVLLLAESSADRQRLSTQLIVTIAPAVQKALTAVTAEAADDPLERPLAQAAATGWASFQTLLAAGALSSATPVSVPALTKQLNLAFDTAISATESMNEVEVSQARQAHDDASSAYRSSVE
jgi:Four helix bundle sensory module for signal transduction